MNNIIIYAKKYFIINQIQRHLENILDLHVYSLTAKLIETLTTRTIPSLTTPDKLIAINWGTSNFPPQLPVISTIINHPDNIKFMRNKLLTLKMDSSAALMFAIADALEVSPRWLALGIGTQTGTKGLADAEKELVLMYRALSTPMRAHLVGVLQGLLELGSTPNRVAPFPAVKPPKTPHK